MSSLPKSRVLVVDDEPGMLEVCAETLAQLGGATVAVEQRSERAAERLRDERWDLLIADVRMPGLGGVELLRRAREEDPTLAVLMITAFPTVETAVECMKLGATDYVTKPFLPEDLLTTAHRLLEAKHLRDEHRFLMRQVDRPHAFGALIGRSPLMHAVFAAIERVASTDADVLILGETGTGKELVARSLHQHSRRSGQRFVPVDCGAIPEDLLESELMGYERGAFTGAHSRSMGLLEFAHRGTFFLDEVGELPQRLQAKLLRTLQERRVRRIGAKEEIAVDVRVIAATAQDLDAEVRLQHFRADLYYRINVARIELPPLRRRVEDIPLLLDHYVRHYAREMGRPDVAVESDVLEVLSCYAWPGNVRELQNVVKRTLVMARHADVIGVEDLPEEIVAVASAHMEPDPAGFFALREQRVGAFEQEYLRDLLGRYHGDIPQVAAEAQLPRGTVYRLMKKYDLTPGGFRD